MIAFTYIMSGVLLAATGFLFMRDLISGQAAGAIAFGRAVSIPDDQLLANVAPTIAAARSS
jgi:hypothetical protein